MKAMITSIFLFTFILGCQLPRTNVQAVDGRSKILVKDAPKGALLFIDGNSKGQADSYNGDPAILLMESGTHLIEVKAGERLLFSQRIFFGGGEIRTIVVQSEVMR